MATVYDIAWRVVSRLGDSVSGTVSSGSDSKFVDSVGLNVYSEDYFRRCALFVLKTTDGLAPQGELGEVTSFTQAANEIALRSALTGALDSGDSYLLSSPRYPLSAIVLSINNTLTNLGGRVDVDTSLSTASNQTEYNLPNSVRDLREVYIQEVDSDSDDNQYALSHDWHIVPADPSSSSQDTLVFSVQPESGKTIKLVHMIDHEYVNAYDDVISNRFDPALIVAGTVVELISSRLHGSNDADPRLNSQLQAAQATYEQLYGVHMNSNPGRTNRLNIIGRRLSWRTSGR